jgi:hypothetical protein
MVFPSPPSSTGTLAVPGSQVPNATFQTDGDNPLVPSGASAFLGASTPFGAEFGTSQNHPYLVLRTDGTAPSTTTFTFAGPTPTSGWSGSVLVSDAPDSPIHARHLREAALAELTTRQFVPRCGGCPRRPRLLPDSRRAPP